MTHRLRPAPALAAPALAAVAVLALAACGSGNAAAGAPAGAPKSGGTLTFAVGSDAGCADPQQVGSNDTIYSLRQIVDSLTDQDPATGKIVPWLAQSWEVSPDATTFTFHLRSGVTFSDGTPVNAKAVKDNFDAVPKLGAKAALAIGYLTGYQGTTVVDELTAAVKFKQPNAQFLQASSTFSLGLVAEASLLQTPDQRCTHGVAGSGPFVLARYVPNQSITLDRRTGYSWGSALFSKSGEAYLDHLVFKVIPEAGVRSGSLQSGQVDAIGSVGLADESALTGSADLHARANPGVVFNLGLNNSRPVLQDIAVRRALLLGIDRKQITGTIFPTGSKPATSILASTTPYYTDDSATLAFDAARARSLLDGAGWTPGPDGIRTRGGARLSLSVTWFANAATNQPTLELIQQQLKVIGVEIKLHQVPIAQITAVQQAGDFDAFWGNLTRADPDILRTQYSTGLSNVYRLPAGELDQLLTQQAAEPDAGKRQQLVTKIQQQIDSLAYVIPVVELTTELGVSKSVHGLNFEASSRIQLHDTWKS